MRKQVKVRVIGERPDVPEGWRIFNAPRPLCGDKVWSGDFRHGVLYAAVDPNGPDVEIWVRRNFQDDAWELTGFLTEDEAIQEAYDRFKAERPQDVEKVDLEDQDFRRWFRDTWIDHEREQAGIRN